MAPFFCVCQASIHGGDCLVRLLERRCSHDSPLSPIPLPPKPTSVSLCELAIAAGTAGQSVTIHFQDFPAHVLCKLWQYSMNFAGPGEVRHVRNQSDIRKLPKACGNAKLVLVHAEKLRTAASWAVEMASLADTEANSRPAIFVSSSPGSDEDDPGVALTLRANPAELSAVARWFAWVRSLPCRTGRPSATTYRCPGSGVGASSVADARARISGVSAACVSRIFSVPWYWRRRPPIAWARGPTSPVVEELTLTTDDYEQVRRLLQSPLWLRPTRLVTRWPRTW